MQRYTSFNALTGFGGSATANRTNGLEHTNRGFNALTGFGGSATVIKAVLRRMCRADLLSFNALTGFGGSATGESNGKFLIVAPRKFQCPYGLWWFCYIEKFFSGAPF